MTLNNLCFNCGEAKNPTTSLFRPSLTKCTVCNSLPRTIDSKSKSIYLEQHLEYNDVIVHDRSEDEMLALQASIKNKTIVYSETELRTIEQNLTEKEKQLYSQDNLGLAFYSQIIIYLILSAALTLSINEIYRMNIHTPAQLEFWKKLQFWSPSIATTFFSIIFLIFHKTVKPLRSWQILLILNAFIVGYAVFKYLGLSF